MPLFKSKSIESDLAEAQQKLATAEAHILELGENLKAVTADRDAAQLEAQTASEGREAALAAAASAKESSEVDRVTVATLATWMGVNGELTQESISEVIDKKAHERALFIAASQGCPPVDTAPGNTSIVVDEVKAEFELASQIEDPVARGKAFAKATAKLNRTK